MKTKKKSLFGWFGRTVAVGLVPLMLLGCNTDSKDGDTIVQGLDNATVDQMISAALADYSTTANANAATAAAIAAALADYSSTADANAATAAAIAAALVDYSSTADTDAATAAAVADALTAYSTTANADAATAQAIATALASYSTTVDADNATAAAIATALATYSTTVDANAATATAIADALTAYSTTANADTATAAAIATALATYSTTVDANAATAAAIAAALADYSTTTAMNTAITDAINANNAAALLTNYTLTTGADNPDGTVMDLSQNNTFYATEATLSSLDSLNGGDGDDTLVYGTSDSTGSLIRESALTLSNIEHLIITADATGGLEIDVTNTTGLTDITESNSSQALTVSGIKAIIPIEINKSASNSTFDYTANAVSGTDTQSITLKSNTTIGNGAIGTITIGDAGTGLETVAITTADGASNLTGLVTGAANITAAGDQNLTISNALVGATAINASTLTGNLDVDADSLNLDVVVTGGIGNDVADFSLNWDAGDIFNGGNGSDTLVLAYDKARATNNSNTNTATSSVEILDIDDLANVTDSINMSSFGTDIQRVILNAGINTGVTTTISNLLSGQIVELDIDNLGGTLTVNAGTAGSTVNMELDNIDTSDSLAINTTNAGTLNIDLDDGATDVLTISTLNIAGTTTLDIDGAADLTVSNDGNPAAGTSVLATIDASGTTGVVTISGVGLPGTGAVGSTGATISLGTGTNTFNVVANESKGADTFNIQAGSTSNTIVYPNDVSASSGVDSDTVNGFVSGRDIINLTALGVQVTSEWLGNAVDSTAAETELTASSGVDQAIFVQDEDVLVVDVDDDGQIGAGDFRVKLTGVASLADSGADLGINAAGVNVTMVAVGTVGTTGTLVTVATNDSTGAAGNTTDGNDQITSTLARADGSTIDGAGGTDTLVLTADNASFTLDLNTAGGGVNTEVDANNVEAVIVNDMASADTLTIAAAQTNGESITVNGADGALNMTVDNDAQAVTVANTTGTTASAITLDDAGAATALTAANVTLGAAGDTVTVNDVDDLSSATINFGAGTDTLTFGGAGTIFLNSTSTDANENDNINANATVTTDSLEQITLNGASTLTTASLNALTITTGNGATTITNSAATQTVNATNLAGANLTLAGATTTTVTNLDDTTSDVTVNAAAGAATVQVAVAGAARTHTITNSSSNTVTADATGTLPTGAADKRVTLTGTGAFSVVDLGHTNGATDGLSITTTGSGAVTMTAIDGDANVLLTGTAGAVTINMAAALTGTSSLQADTGSTQAFTVNNLEDADVLFQTVANTAVATVNTVAGTGDITTGAGADTINIVGAGARTITPGGGNDTISLDAATVGSVQQVRVDAAGTTSVDTVSGTNFTIAEDMIGISQGNITTPFGTLTVSGGGGTDLGADISAVTTVAANGGAAAAVATGSNVNFIQATSTAATSFATALGTSTVTVSNFAAGEVIVFVWYDSANSQAVFGIADPLTDGTATNVSQNDRFIEYARVGMNSTSYGILTHAEVLAY